jgi:glycosyltransferase involved in cell wall biosynthesis/peptidoglycan/xylan/chitin deacetylase (PgdA/CDA1 family)
MAATQTPPLAGPKLQLSRPTRVLYIIDSLSNVGGAEMCLLRLTRKLPRPQFQCQVLTFHSSEAARNLREKFDCPVHYWQLNNISDATAFRAAAQLRRLVREEQIDIVHTFFHTSDLWAGPIAKLSGAKVLISSRRDMGILREPRHNLAYMAMRGIFDQVQTVSERVRQWTIEKDGIDPDRAVTIHNGIETLLPASSMQAERLRRLLNVPVDAPIISTVANFRSEKGIDVLVRAASTVVRRSPDAHIVVAGSFGNTAAGRVHFEEVVRLRRAAGLEERVHFIGAMEDIPSLLRITDIFVLASRSEGLSNALLEAMVAGLPSVATAVGGNPEVVVDGETGYLVASEDSAALADRILKLLDNPDLRKRMGEAGRSRAIEQFSVERMVARVIESYENLLRTKCPEAASYKSRIVSWPASRESRHPVTGLVQAPHPRHYSSMIGTVAKNVGLNTLLRHCVLHRRLLVLCYHGVLNHPPGFRHALSTNVLTSEFESQVKFIAKTFHLPTADEFCAIIEGREKLPPGSAVVTFDDGYRNNVFNAAPILRAHNVPAIFNVSTGFIGSRQLMWFDEMFLLVLRWPERKIPLPNGGVAQLPAADNPERESFATAIQEFCKRVDTDHCLSYLDTLRTDGLSMELMHREEMYEPMTWNDVRELHQMGFEIGSHTVTHAILSRVRKSQLEYELRASKAQIESEVGCECRIIAYPNGTVRDARADVWKAAIAAGYRIGFTLQRGLARTSESMTINRINLPGGEPSTLFEARAAGVYAVLY